jgi:toxin ParE1/3/4
LIFICARRRVSLRNEGALLASRSGRSSIDCTLDRERSHAARRISRDLRTACLALGETPRAYEVVDDRQYPEIRRRPFSRYLICYRVEEKQVVIVRILDGARNFEPLL